MKGIRSLDTRPAVGGGCSFGILKGTTIPAQGPYRFRPIEIYPYFHQELIILPTQTANHVKDHCYPCRRPLPVLVGPDRTTNDAKETRADTQVHPAPTVSHNRRSGRLVRPGHEKHRRHHRQTSHVETQRLQPFHRTAGLSYLVLE